MNKLENNNTNEPNNIFFTIGEIKKIMIEQELNDEFYDMCECILKTKNHEEAFDIIKMFYHIFLK